MTSFTDSFTILRRDDNFREYTPYARGNAARITDDQWEPFFPLIRQLHNARHTRVQIRAVLRQHGLEPSVAQLYAKMSNWGLKGYGPVINEQRNLTTDVENDSAFRDVPVALHDGRRAIRSFDSIEDSSEDSQTSHSTNCFSSRDVDSSDTVYETEGPPIDYDCENTGAEPIAERSIINDELLEDTLSASITSVPVESSEVSLLQNQIVQRLPSDLMTFVHSTVDISEFDRHDILNEVGSFLCATGSFSDAFVLFNEAYTFLRDSQTTPMALVFATINCLRSATFKEQCEYAGSLMGEALTSFRLLSYTSPYAATAFSSLEQIGREICVKSELESLNILYTHMQLREMSSKTGRSSRSNASEVLLHCSDPFLLARADDRPELLTQSMELNTITLGRIVGRLSCWCCSAIEDFNPVSMLPSAGFNPSDPVSVARFATALSCHFIRKWSFMSLSDILGHCNELLPPHRKDAATRLCKLTVRILSTLAVYTIYQATGSTLRSVLGTDIILPEHTSQYVSPLASHLDMLARMRSKERVLVFAEMHKTLYNRTLVYRQRMDDHCLIAYVRETGFLLAASLIRLKRELNTEVPQPSRYDITSRVPTPAQDSDSVSRKSSGSSTSSSMRRLAKRNLLVPGIMSKNGSHLRPDFGTRRLSTDSNESWNFTKVTGLPSGPSPPESVGNQMQCDENENDYTNDNEDHEMTGIDAALF